MSLFYKHFNMVLEVTEEGELLLPEYDPEYDMAFEAFGGPRSPELLFQDDWNTRPLTVFLSFGLSETTRTEILLVGRTLVETFVGLAGFAEVEGFEVETLGQKIHEAGERFLIGVGGGPLDAIHTRLGQIASDLQRRRWTIVGGSHYDPHIDPPRCVVEAAENYIYMIYGMEGVEAYWSEKGRDRAIEKVDQLVRSSLSELTTPPRWTAMSKQEQSWAPGELPIPLACVQAAQKHCIGAIVRTLSHARNR